ncbi:GNAT family N-acetyltransferase [Antrihabitans cavernicola]|uniref:N-acetyltransferase n=1 Tax=Antrihabitans cavernicola TaxID=2495913 RepID=A0A5A7S7K6_9NOCA|nr:GNAT family N-acetyltransferase [Spelaeibacter cavernicola]KAA0022130.1 N-acetyltransferase [Spelaeibacter cavernicola]
MLANSPSAEVSNNADQNRFELRLNGDLVGILAYYEFDSAPSRRPGRVTVVSFMHTVITEDFGHRGLASVMVRGALDQARRYGWKVRPVCSYVQRFVGEHPEYRDVVLPSEDRPERIAR